DSRLYFHDHWTPEIYSLSLHDALPIYRASLPIDLDHAQPAPRPAGVGDRDALVDGASLGPSAPTCDDPCEVVRVGGLGGRDEVRSEEHTSELQSRENLVCRLLLEKKNK